MKMSFYNPLFSLALLLIPAFCHAQDQAFIYGKIYTEDDHVYEGAIRWGKEEAYWVDLFNASKQHNDNLRYLSDKQREKLEDRQSDWFSWDDRISGIFHTIHWGSNHNDGRFIHQFACQFGELKSITPMGRKYAEVELQNGQRFEVDGEGYNDIGPDIRITDKELGEAHIEWTRIRKIEFMDTPANLQYKFGAPLYGTVEAFGGKFTGYIQWDHDERISTDKLDGDTHDGDFAIEFGKIRSIEKQGGRSLVTLRSGRQLTLHGSNDVSSGHRGVIVMNNELTSVDIPWNEFEKVVFEEKAPTPLASYKDFASQKALGGKVTTLDGKTLTGRIVYDLDETHDYELLQGKEDDFAYATAFRSIKKLTPRSTHRCTVELRNGKTVVLDDGQDVNEKNQGVLVFEDNKSEPQYIPWNEISAIEFK